MYKLSPHDSKNRHGRSHRRPTGSSHITSASSGQPRALPEGACRSVGRSSSAHSGCAPIGCLTGPDADVLHALEFQARILSHGCHGPPPAQQPRKRPTSIESTCRAHGAPVPFCPSGCIDAKEALNVRRCFAPSPEHQPSHRIVCAQLGLNRSNGAARRVAESFDLLVLRCC